METIADTTIGTSEFGSGNIVIDQDEDRVVVMKENIWAFVAAIGRIYEGKGPAPEKWYVVLENSNAYLTTHDKEPMTFTEYEDARRYGGEFGGRSRRYVPISVDEYERTFGR